MAEKTRAKHENTGDVTCCLSAVIGGTAASWPLGKVGRSRLVAQILIRGIPSARPRVVAGVWDVALSEKAMISKHLDRLQREGRVMLEENRYRLVG